jgi:hypothetical protein
MYPKGLFWIKNDFIRKHARKLSIHAQMIYVALCCHANKDGITFIGCRKIGEDLGINKNTAQIKIKELEKAQLVKRLDSANGKPSHMKIFTVPYEKSKPYSQVIPKDNTKDIYKDKTIQYKKFLYGRWEELDVYLFPDGYKTIGRDGTLRPFERINEIKKLQCL